jgi:hypothetical protein
VKLIRWERLPPDMQKEEVRKYYDILKKKRFSLFLKRLFDIAVSAAMLFVLLPFFLLLGIAIKIDDGNGDVRNMVVVEVLRQLGVINDSNIEHFEKWTKKEVRNHKKELVGYTLPDFNLHKAE